MDRRLVLLSLFMAVCCLADLSGTKMKCSIKNDTNNEKYIHCQSNSLRAIYNHQRKFDQLHKLVVKGSFSTLVFPPVELKSVKNLVVIGRPSVIIQGTKALKHLKVLRLERSDVNGSLTSNFPALSRLTLYSVNEFNYERLSNNVKTLKLNSNKLRLSDLEALSKLKVEKMELQQNTADVCNCEFLVQFYKMVKATTTLDCGKSVCFKCKAHRSPFFPSIFKDITKLDTFKWTRNCKKLRGMLLNAVTIKQAPVTTQQAAKQLPVKTQKSSKQAPVTTKKTVKQLPVTTQKAVKQLPVTTQTSTKQAPVTTQKPAKQLPVTTQKTAKQLPVTTPTATKQLPVTTQKAAKQLPVTTQTATKQLPVTTQKATKKPSVTTQRTVTLTTLPVALNKSLEITESQFTIPRYQFETTASDFTTTRDEKDTTTSGKTRPTARKDKGHQTEPTDEIEIKTIKVPVAREAASSVATELATRKETTSMGVTETTSFKEYTGNTTSQKAQIRRVNKATMGSIKDSSSASSVIPLNVMYSCFITLLFVMF